MKINLYEIESEFMSGTGFGARLRALRMKNKLSLQALADRIGASKAHVWDLEQGNTKNPTLALLTELSRALNTPIKELVGESDATSDAESSKLAPLFRDLRGLSDSELDLIKTMTDKLREQQGGGDKSGG